MKRILTLLFLATLLVAIPAAAADSVKWTVSVDSVSPTQGVIVWKADITPGWHIYGDDMPSSIGGIPTYPTSFTINPVEGLHLDGKPVSSVAPETHLDMTMNLELPQWTTPVSFSQKFNIDSGTKGVVISGTINYMACNDRERRCTPPASEDFAVTFGASVPIVSNEVELSDDDLSKAASTVVKAESNEWWQPAPADFNEAVTGSPKSMWMIFILGFFGGLLALLTPCVWPMIPMTVSFFLKTNKDRRRSILNACLYGLSIIVIFLVLGMAITAIFGASKLNEISTSAFFNLIFFALLVFFAVSFLGAFEIKLPARWADAMDSKAEATTGVISIFFMAFTLVLVSFSCTGPIIGTLLVEAASEGNYLGPAIGMGGFALGLALPFGLFAFFPSMLKSLPSSGGWLNSVKVVLGFIELILSLKFLSVADLAYGWRLLDREAFVAIWIVLFILLGLYLLGKLRFSHDSESKHTSVLGFFLAVVSFSFSVYLLPGLWGAPLKAISAFAPPLYTQDFNLYGGQYMEFDDYNEGMAYAAQHHKPVIVDFTGYGCVNCRKMEMAVFDTPEVRSVIENDYVLIKLYVDEKTSLSAPYSVEEEGKKVKIRTVGDEWSYLQRHKFHINSQPYYVLLDNEGMPLAPPRSYDENVSAFVEWLNQGAATYSKR